MTDKEREAKLRKVWKGWGPQEGCFDEVFLLRLLDEARAGKFDVKKVTDIIAYGMNCGDDARLIAERVLAT